MDLSRAIYFVCRLFYISVTLSAVIASPRITIKLDALLQRSINFDYPEFKQTLKLSLGLSLLASLPLEYNMVPLVRRHLKLWFILPALWSAVCCLMFLQNMLLLCMALYSSWDIRPDGWLMQQIFLYVCFFHLAIELMSHWKVLYDIKFPFVAFVALKPKGLAWACLFLLVAYQTVLWGVDVTFR